MAHKFRCQCVKIKVDYCVCFCPPLAGPIRWYWLSISLQKHCFSQSRNNGESTDRDSLRQRGERGESKSMMGHRLLLTCLYTAAAKIIKIQPYGHCLNNKHWEVINQEQLRHKRITRRTLQHLCLHQGRLNKIWNVLDFRLNLLRQFCSALPWSKQLKKVTLGYEKYSLFSC